MKSANETLTEVEHLDNLARETKDVAHGVAAIALLDELSERQQGPARWSTMSFALRLRLTWTPTDAAVEAYFQRFAREVEAAPHRDVVQAKVARGKILSALKSAPAATTEAMRRWQETTDCRITPEDVAASGATQQ